MLFFRRPGDTGKNLFRDGNCDVEKNSFRDMKRSTTEVPAEDRQRFMQMAVDLSEQALDAGKGGPFGAIIVRGTRIVGSSGNCVFKHTDPTAHAEIMAIRDACENLGSDDLSGCDIYSSSEPCPMCMAAIYWAKIGAVYFSNTEKDALRYGFVDKLILAE